MISNRVNPRTDGNDPIKLYDYRAMGRPIVSTATAGVATIIGLVDVAGSREEFMARVDCATTNDTEERRRARFARTRLESWEASASQVADALERRVFPTSEAPNRASHLV